MIRKPMVVSLLEYAQIIGPEQAQKLADDIAANPDVPAEELAVNAGYISAEALKDLRYAVELLSLPKQRSESEET